MPTATTLFLGSVLPGLVATFLLALGWRAWRRELPAPAGSASTPAHAAPPGAWIGPLALVAAYLVGYVATNGLPPFPPKEAKQWLPTLAPMFAGLALFAAWLRTCPQGRLAQWPLHLAAIGALVWLLLRPILANPFPYMPIDVWLQARPYVGLGAITLLGVATLAGLDAALSPARSGDHADAVTSDAPPEVDPAPARPPRGTGPALLLTTWAAIAAAAIGDAGSFGFALMMGALSAGAGAVFVLSLWAPRVSMTTGGALLAWWPLAFGYLVAAILFTELPWWSALVLALAPQAAWVARVPRLGGLESWRGVAVAGVLLVAIGVAAVAPVVLRDQGGSAGGASSSASGADYGAAYGY